MAIQAVCFDLGGVVARISYHWAEMLERCGLPVPPYVRANDPLNAMPDLDRYQAGELTDDEYLSRLATYLGGIGVDEALRVHMSMLIGPYPGVLDVVERLNAQGIVTGCLSNTNAPHWHDLAFSGRFPAIMAMKVRLASHEIDLAKPDPRAFDAFERATGISGHATLLFDDSLANCQSAGALGWETLRIDPDGDTAQQMQERLASCISGSELF